jgi:hypothetical protein
MLSNGEYVLNARATERLGLPFLNFLNGLGHRPATRIPAFAAGGPVSTAGARAGGRGGPAASVQLSPTFVVQAGGGLLHRELLVRELGPAMRQMAIEQMDGIIRQLGLNPAAVTARG